MSGVAVAVVGGAVVGGIIASKGAKDAAQTQADALSGAQATIIGETRNARQEILNRMVPALQDYGSKIDDLQDYVAEGTVDVMNILRESTVNAMQVLENAGANARQAILGSTASAQGVARQDFTSQYQGMIPSPSTPGGLTPEEQGISAQAPAPSGLYANANGVVSSSPTNFPTPTPNQPAPTTAAAPQGGSITPTLARSAFSGSAARSGSSGAINPFEGDGMSGGSLNPFEGRQDNTTLGDIARNAPVNTIPGYEFSTYEPYFTRPTPDINTVPMIEVSPGNFVPATDIPGGGEIGFAGADLRLQEGQSLSLAQLAQGTNIARQDITSGANAALQDIYGSSSAALGRLNPYSQAGQSALWQEAAMSGTLGPEAQQQAINNFIESPGQQYLRERQEQALVRNASATGDLGGGRVRTALMEQAMGIASTQQQEYLQNLRDLAVRGQSADTTGAGILQTAGSNAANIRTNAATQLAQLAEALGVRGANLTAMTAQERSALAERTGLSLAQLEQVIGAAQSGALASLGGQLANTYAGGLADVAQLGITGANNQLQGQQSIAQILANLATQSGTQIAGLQTAQGSALAAGQAQSAATIGQMFQDVGQLSAYTLANRAATPTINTNGYYPGTITPNGAYVGTTGTTAYGM